MLNESIEDIEISNEFSLDKLKYDYKIGALDIKAKINKSKLIDMEMQRTPQKYYTERILLYVGNLLATQLKDGEKYSDMKDSIAISILDFIEFPKIPKIHTIWHLREDDYINEPPLKGIELHFIELPKFRNSNPNLQKEFNQWLTLIDTENKDWLEVAMKNNENVKKAVGIVEDFVSDDETRILIELRQKWQRDYDSSISDAKEDGIEIGLKKGLKQGKREGIKEGIKKGIEKGIKQGFKQGIEQGIEKGIEKGIEQGIEKGIEQGIEKGINQEKIETTKKLLKLNNMSIEQISQITNISIDEINNIK